MRNKKGFVWSLVLPPGDFLLRFNIASIGCLKRPKIKYGKADTSGNNTAVSKFPSGIITTSVPSATIIDDSHSKNPVQPKRHE